MTHNDDIKIQSSNNVAETTRCASHSCTTNKAEASLKKWTVRNLPPLGLVENRSLLGGGHHNCCCVRVKFKTEAETETRSPPLPSHSPPLSDCGPIEAAKQPARRVRGEQWTHTFLPSVLIRNPIRPLLFPTFSCFVSSPSFFPFTPCVSSVVAGVSWGRRFGGRGGI